MTKAKNMHSFSIKGRSYTVNNSSYNYKDVTDEYFEVRKCPKCNTLNSAFVNHCEKCKAALNFNSVYIARRKKRTAIAALICGVSSFAFLMLMILITKFSPGYLITFAVMYATFKMGKAIAGNKIVIDDEATWDYKDYLKDAFKESIREASVEEMDQFQLVRNCPYCKAAIESDSVFCSNCGTKLK